jgi:UDP-N-acetylmuramyl-tripeptide synthetase
MQRLTTPAQAAEWLTSRLPAGRPPRLVADSRRVRPGDAFLAWPGQVVDARHHVGAALAAGAAACLVESGDIPPAMADALAETRVAALPGLKAAAGEVADAVLGQPSARLAVLAVTGTNGKTSSAWWLAQALSAAGRRCGLVGTLGVGEPPSAAAAAADPQALGSLQPTGLTSPDAPSLHMAFADFVRQGFAACALEASSIGLVDHRLTGTRITVALFTNFTRDHLDVHGSMGAYWAAKRRLFDWPGLQAAVVNIDDIQGAALAAELQGQVPDLWTVSRLGPARLQALDLRVESNGMGFDLAEGAQRASVYTPLVGDYNVSNLLGVAAGLRALGLPLAEVALRLQALSPVPGRLQRAGAAGESDIEVLVDYAHTPDALEKALRALRPLAQARGGRLVCVFGCGGNRDASKRPLMGAIAEREADLVVLTSDNPRLEDPQAILADIVAGHTRPALARVLADRAEAIAQTVAAARPGDVLLLAGKGHEDYQDMGGHKRPFSDLALARAALCLRAGVTA